MGRTKLEGGKTTVSVRFPTELIKEINDNIKGNDFYPKVIELCQKALAEPIQQVETAHKIHINQLELKVIDLLSQAFLINEQKIGLIQDQQQEEIRFALEMRRIQRAEARASEFNIFISHIKHHTISDKEINISINKWLKEVEKEAKEELDLAQTQFLDMIGKRPQINQILYEHPDPVPDIETEIKDIGEDQL